jgi:hypothetical protein
MQLSANNTYTVPEGFTARITLEPVPKIAPGYNPQNLTIDQVGAGYRLLEKEETDLDWNNHDWPIANKQEVEVYRTACEADWPKGWSKFPYPNIARYGYRVPLSWVHPSKRSLPLTPEQILSNWITTYDVKVGDLVRVTGKEKAIPWVSGMDDQINSVGKVCGISDRFVRLDTHGYTYSPLDLEKVTERQVPLEKEDWEGEWYIRSSDGLRIYKVTSTSSHMVYSGPHYSYRYDTLSDGCQRSRDLQSWTPCTKTTYIPTPPNPINQAKNAEECHF